MALKEKDSKVDIIATNRKALHDYEILETFEAGLVLEGHEVKAMRERKATFTDSFARVERGEVFLYNLYILPYSHASQRNLEPARTRKLLLHRAQIERLMGKVQQRGCTLVPLKLYFKEGFAKVELALAKGRQKGDKRERLRKREHDREVERALRHKH